MLAAAAPAAAQMPGGAPQAPPGALERYFSGSTATHWATPGPVSGDYQFEFPLGFLETTPGPGRVALYGCLVGASDRMLSTDPGCEHQTVLGRYGWLDAQRTDDWSVPLYRCWWPAHGTHFASNDAGCEGQTTEFRLGYTRARQDALSRYNGPEHWDSSGTVGGGYSLEATLGFELPAGGAGRSALYECAVGGDHFLSLDAGCEGQRELGLSGYVYSAAPGTEDVVGLYRCTAGGEHFSSNDPGCEGQHVEARLGYLRRDQEILQRAYNPSTGTHWVTTGPIGPGWFWESSLGFALTRAGSDRRPVFGCLHGSADHFLSLSSGCEGQSGEGQHGWLYSSPPAGVDSSPVYRCRTGGDHFASNAANCEGQTSEGLLGYARTSSPEPPPAAPESLRFTCTPSSARISTSLHGRKVRRVHYGGRARINGRARNVDGSPAVGVPVYVLIGARKPVVFAQTSTGADGGYAVTVKPRKNRILHVGFRPGGSSPELACSRSVKLNVRAGLRLHASPHRVPPGGRVRFRGTLIGHPIPRVGKLIDLQAFDGGRWRTFMTVRAHRSGAFRARYRFTRTFSARTFRFRAQARRESRYPYALGYSRVVRVRVR